MKIYKLPQLAESSPEGGYLLGPEDLMTDAVYLSYRSIPPRGPEAMIPAKDGFEEVVYVLKGSVRVSCEKSEFSATAGEAFHPKGAIRLDNPGDGEAVYIVAGGRARGGPSKAEKSGVGEAVSGPNVAGSAVSGSKDSGVKPPNTATREVECAEAAAAAEDNAADFIITTEDSSEEGRDD
jgi:hypothetical protein